MSSAAAFRVGVLLGGLALLPLAAQAQTFVDATSAAGFGGYVQHVLSAFEDCILGPFQCPERMTGGATVGDYNGDGAPDLYVTILDGPDKLFENQGNGTFVDVAAAADLGAYGVQSNGAVFADLDNDGDADLYVTVMGAAADPANNRNYLFLNDGDGTFTEDAVARGADAGTAEVRIATSVAVGDYDRDGWLDLFVGEWRPDGLSTGPSHARLLRNRGVTQPGYFDDVTAAAGIDLGAIPVFLPGKFVFAPAFVDLDDDLWPDLTLASDFGTSRVYWNNGDGTFSDGTDVSGVGSDENGMGSTFGDVDGDGDLDWFVTSIHDAAETCETVSCNWGYTGNRLYRNEGGRRFLDATDPVRVRKGFWGWGAAFFDWDNDADLDLVMTNGVDFPGTPDDVFLADPMRLWRNSGGSMTEVSAADGVTDTGSGKGLLVFDGDGDGDQDLFVVNNGAAPVYYENQSGAANGWLRVRVQGTDSNRDGRGARVWLTASAGGAVQVREIGAGSHFLGESEQVAHFGLGPGSGPLHELRVRWPNGRMAAFAAVARNQELLLVEPATDPCNDGFDNDADGLVDHPLDPGCSSPTDAWETDAALVCDNGLDDDGDGSGDFPRDAGCDDGLDASEKTVAYACDNALDDDSDGMTDYPADPGCRLPTSALEVRACQDGLNNDGQYGTDFDGGASLNGGVPFDYADPECEGKPWRRREAPGYCGLGFELTPLLLLIGWRRRHRSARR